MSEAKMRKEIDIFEIYVFNVSPSSLFLAISFQMMQISAQRKLQHTMA